MPLGFGSDPTVCMQCIVKVVKVMTKPVNLQKSVTLTCASQFLKVLNSFECSLAGDNYEDLLVNFNFL